jgi:hypothetical protein
MVRWLLVASCGLALGCAARVEARAPAAPASEPSPWALVYVDGTEGTLERLDATTSGWVVACSGRCGDYVLASGVYRVRGTEVTSASFSLPPPDLGRVVLRFDDDGHVWTHKTPTRLRQPQPFLPSFVMLWR